MFLGLSSRRRTNLFNDILFHKYSRFPNSSLVSSLGVLCSLRLPLFPGSDCAKAPPSGSSLVWKAVGQETVRATTNPCKRSLASHHHPSSQLFPLYFASEPNINFSLETKRKMPEALQDHKTIFNQKIKRLPRVLPQIVRKNQHIWHVGVWVGLYEWVSFKRWQRILQPADNANCSTLYHFQSTQIQLYFYKNTFIYLWKYNCKSIEEKIQIWTKTIANTKWYQHVRGGSNYFNLLIH